MPVVPFRQVQPAPTPKLEIEDTYLAIAAASMHESNRLFEPDPKPLTLDEHVRTHGAARFDPTIIDSQSKKYLENLPDDIERIERGSTIELRLKKKGEEIPMS